MSQEISAKIAESFMRRSEALGLKGRKRDEFALEYFIGAAYAYLAAGMTEECNNLSAIAGLMIAPRGYHAVQELGATEFYVSMRDEDGTWLRTASETWTSDKREAAKYSRADADAIAGKLKDENRLKLASYRALPAI